MITYPRGEITPMGARMLLEGTEPHISYVSYNDSMVFHLMGPMSPMPGVQAGVTIAAESIKGLIAPWQTLDQSGANQDGVTFQDAVYGPAEIDMLVEVHGQTAEETRTVIRDWVGSWDAHSQGELQVLTPEQGLWWAPVRWLKAPTDAMMRASSNRQRFLWTCRLDDSFWRSYDSVGSFQFDYTAITETFNFTAGSLAATTLGTNWPLRYDQPNNADRGYIYADGSQARWRDGTAFFSREVVAGPYKDFSTDTDNQVINMVLGTIPEVSLPKSAYNDIWGRMGRNANGTWNGNGIRARFGFGYVSLHRFNNFIPTLLAERFLLVPPLMGEKWSLLCGFEGNTRLFKVLRNGGEVLACKENGTGSVLNSTHRGIGFGMSAALAIITQATPASVRKISAGDNSNVSQQGYLPLTNDGDVASWPRYLLYGPGTFSMGNGPDSSDVVTLGPLVEGQIVLIETDPRRRSVIDLTPSELASNTPQLGLFQQLIKALVSFATNNNTPPLLEEFESLFGIAPPQGNLYSLMSGRFTAPLPARPSGSTPVTSQIFVRIDDGTADSKIVGAVTPRRKWPL
jgi:hypothetical protein